MGSQANPYVSVDEYLDREASSVERHEYLNGKIFLIAGVTLGHSAIAANVIAAIGLQLVDTNFIVRGWDTRIRTSPSGLY